MVPWCHGVIARDPRPPTALLEFSFRQEGGGGLPLGPPPSLPWTPSPPSPICSNSPENQGSGNVFAFGPFFSSRAFGAPIARFFGHSILSFLPSVANTMSQRPISAFFSTPVQPCPGAKRDDVVNAILYFRFQDRWTGKKRQEAYNVAQKACSTLFLNTPMATLREFIRQAAVISDVSAPSSDSSSNLDSSGSSSSSEEDDIGESGCGESHSD